LREKRAFSADISDVFEEGGFAFANNSFNGNFGLVNVHGVPKPAYRAFQLLHELGDELLPTTRTGGGSSSSPTDCAASVGVLASKSNATCLSVLVFSQATVGAPIARLCSVNLTVKMPADADVSIAGDDVSIADADLSNDQHRQTKPETTIIQGAVRRIDETHTAPKNAWLAMGMPQWPTSEQNRKIFEASIMEVRKTHFFAPFMLKAIVLPRQDKLGTNIGKVEKKGRRSCRQASCPSRRVAVAC
jgi:xylan 1,4-beta-xylosidase